MRVLLDCDGVLGDFTSEVVRFCNLYARKTGEPEIRLEDVTDFDILECLGFSEFQDQLDQHLAATNYCARMPVLPGSQAFVEKIRTMGHEVVIVTSPYSAVPNWGTERTRWLWRHFGVHADDVILAKRKDRIAGDVLVDDKLDNLRGFRDRGILFDQPWNRDNAGAFRAKTYQDVVARLRWIDGA